MIEKALFLFTAIFVLGGCSFLFFITTLFTASGSKSRKVSLSLFAGSVLLLIGTSVYTVYKVKHKVEEMIESPMVTTMAQTPYKSSQIELLKSYTPDTLRSSVPETFYTYFGFRDWYRYPLVYPYSLNCIDEKNYGTIVSESGVADIEYDGNGSRNTAVQGIVQFGFNQDYLVAKCVDHLSTKKDTSYVVFEFKNENSAFYNNTDEFEQALYEINFTGGDSLISVPEYEELF